MYMNTCAWTWTCIILQVCSQATKLNSHHVTNIVGQKHHTLHVTRSWGGGPRATSTQSMAVSQTSHHTTGGSTLTSDHLVSTSATHVHTHVLYMHHGTCRSAKDLSDRNTPNIINLSNEKVDLDTRHPTSRSSKDLSGQHTPKLMPIKREGRTQHKASYPQCMPHMTHSSPPHTSARTLR